MLLRSLISRVGLNIKYSCSSPFLKNTISKRLFSSDISAWYKGSHEWEDEDFTGSHSQTAVMSMHKSNSGVNNGITNGLGTKTPFLIGVAGGTASGKSTVCKRIMERLGQDDLEHSQRRVVCISQDAFYRPLTPEENTKAMKGTFNFDHPDAFDSDLLLKTVKQILDGKICKIPNYDYVTNARL
ncbi:unnamed protein product, partial [Meganyctiphanes norvegica]